MQDNNEAETKIINILTQFLQFFKNTLISKLNLIESICLNPQKHLLTQSQFLITKMTSKNFKYQPLICPFEIGLNSENYKVIQRFYLRISQFLQYRLCSLLRMSDAEISKEVQSFHKEMQKIFNGIKNIPQQFVSKKYELLKKSQIKNVGSIFLMISELEIKFSLKILDVIGKKMLRKELVLVDEEIFGQIQNLIKDKIIKQCSLKRYLEGKQWEKNNQNQNLKLNEAIYHIERSQKTKIKESDLTKLKGWIHEQQEIENQFEKRGHSHHRQKYSSLSPIDHSYSTKFLNDHSQNANHTHILERLQKPKDNQTLTHINQIKFQDRIQKFWKQLSLQENQQHKDQDLEGDHFIKYANQENLSQKPHNNLDLLDLEEVVTSTREEIMSSLSIKNQKNQAMILKFIKKYKRKQRKAASEESKQLIGIKVNSSNKSMRTPRLQESEIIIRKSDKTEGVSFINRSTYKHNKMLNLGQINTKFGCYDRREEMILELPLIKPSRRKTGQD